MLSVNDFDQFHRAVHGQQKGAFGWQTRLLQQITTNRAWPSILDLPTGSGKTTCLDIALFALALDAENPPDQRWCPRRIAMVVDRRIVVDQVAERGRAILRALIHHHNHPILMKVATRLCSYSRKAEEPLGVFTLRGGIPKDDTWARTPDQPLILASTVDQLGSRLLIQGYGVSQGMKPVHAGLLSNDLLVLLDEVHLSQPFAETLESLSHLRARFQQESGVDSRFHHVSLSATPGHTPHSIFRLTEEDLDPQGALGTRLHAKKPARLHPVKDRTQLEEVCIEQAQVLLKKHRVIGIILNRTSSATRIARALSEAVGNQVDITVLTGRMRPLDRDDILEILRPRIMTGRVRTQTDRPQVIVGTQCIEAGADFDFDAIITESASLDALRQRFGRLDRLGVYGKSEGLIVHPTDTKEDPIYGMTIGNTLRWIKERLTKGSKTIDFGITALPHLTQEECEQLLTPKKHAPILLPAYLDLWMQTSPAPQIIPDVSLWLHGPNSGPADIQVIWRADLTEDDLVAASAAEQGSHEQQVLAHIVGAIRPSSLEAISLPFIAAQRWLNGESDTGPITDVEGITQESVQQQQGLLGLRWNGTDAEVIRSESLRPGDTIIIPTTRGGLYNGCFDHTATTPVHDLAERAALVGRGIPVLRLHPTILKQWELTFQTDNLTDIRATLRDTAKQLGQSTWQKPWMDALGHGKMSHWINHRDPWLVLEGRRIKPTVLRHFFHSDTTLENGIDTTTDEDDSYCLGRTVSLAHHSQHVEDVVRIYASTLLPKFIVEDLALAGWLHDIGKADQRFQIMLRGGSPIDYLKDPTCWAKSGIVSGDKHTQHLAHIRSEYPKGMRHEVLSLAMVNDTRAIIETRAHDLDLVLHLVASHHGYCRPLAPAIEDPTPLSVTLPQHTSQTFGTITFGPTSTQHDLHKIESTIAERFWRLVAKYGWHELCWFEAILRLADHRASEEEQYEYDTL